MYYVQVGISIVFIISFFASLTYLLWLSVKVATRLVDRKDVTRKSFMALFITSISIFSIVIIWQDKSNWNIGTWIIIFSVLTSISIVSAAILAFGSWHLKKIK